MVVAGCNQDPEKNRVTNKNNNNNNINNNNKHLAVASQTF